MEYEFKVGQKYMYTLGGHQPMNIVLYVVFVKLKFVKK